MGEEQAYSLLHWQGWSAEMHLSTQAEQLPRSPNPTDQLPTENLNGSKKSFKMASTCSPFFFHQRKNFFSVNISLIFNFAKVHVDRKRVYKNSNLMISYCAHDYRWESFLSFKVNCIWVSFLLSSEIQYFSPIYQISCQIQM